MSFGADVFLPHVDLDSACLSEYREYFLQLKQVDVEGKHH